MGEDHLRHWRKRAFARACKAANVGSATLYALRHSFASLLIHEGRSVMYVAKRNARIPRRGRGTRAMELGGLEPPTSWVRSRRSPN